MKTSELRQQLGLGKTGKKTEEKFSAHCVDSWVLANSVTGGHSKPDNEKLLIVQPLQLSYRQLHVMNPKKGKRRKLGGTRSLGFTRGALVVHPQYKLCYVGGCTKKRVSLHSIKTGERLTKTAKPEECKLLTHNKKIVRSAIPHVG